MSNNQTQGASVEADRACLLVKELDRIAMSLAADLVAGAAYSFQGHDYLDREFVMERVVRWRTEWDATSAERITLLQAARRTPAPAGAGELPTSAALDNALQRLVTAWQPAIASPNVVQARVADRSEVMRMFADLRAQLARTETNLQTAVQEAWKANAALTEARAQLARQEQGMSNAEAAAWARENGLNVPPQWDASAQPDRGAAQRIAERFANRPRTPATADFDLPAPNDVIESAALPQGAQVGGQWISVEEQMPEGRYCLAVYETPRGHQRIIRAMYVRQFEVEATGDECDSEYNEADDRDYLKAGWLECIDNWGEYSSVYVTEGKVTHWMPLPATPSKQPHSTATEGADGMGGKNV